MSCRPQANSVVRNQGPTERALPPGQAPWSDRTVHVPQHPGVRRRPQLPASRRRGRGWGVQHPNLLVGLSTGEQTKATASALPQEDADKKPQALAGLMGGIPLGEDGGQLGRGQLHLTHGLQQWPGDEGQPSLHTEGQDPSPALLRGGPWTGTGCSPGQEDLRTEWDTASLAAQGLGIRTSAGTGLDPWVCDPTGRGAAKPTRPSALEPVVWRSHGDEKPDTKTREPACGEDRVQ